MHVILKEQWTKQDSSMQDIKKYQAFTVFFYADHRCILYITSLIFRNMLNTYRVH